MPETNFGKLQHVQNTLARVLTETGRYYRVKQEVIHITPDLSMLHWLPVKAPVTFILATLVYNIRQTGSPPYLTSLLSDYNPIRELHSTDKHLLAASRSTAKTSEIAFHHGLEYSCTDNQRMWHSRFIQQTSENTSVGLQHRLQKYLSWTPNAYQWPIHISAWSIQVLRAYLLKSWVDPIYWRQVSHVQ